MAFWRISRETEVHVIPKTWESEFLLEKRMGKHKHSKTMRFLHISFEALIHTISNIWKVTSRSNGKIWENTNIPKLRVS